MTPTGTARRPSAVRVACAAAGAGALVAAAVMAAPRDTVASFTDNVWAGSKGFSASQFGIQSSLTPAGPFADNPATRPLELAGSATPGVVAFSTPLALTPGASSYAPVYLRTSAGSTKGATVSVSAAVKTAGSTNNDALWNTYVTYAARAVPTTTTTDCTPAVWTASLGAQLYGPDSPLTASAPTTTFTLGPSGTTTVMVCFRFTLAANVVTAAPAGTNGATVHPGWTFTGIETS